MLVPGRKLCFSFPVQANNKANEKSRVKGFDILWVICWRSGGNSPKGWKGYSLLKISEIRFGKWNGLTAGPTRSRRPLSCKLEWTRIRCLTKTCPACEIQRANTLSDLVYISVSITNKTKDLFYDVLKQNLNKISIILFYLYKLLNYFKETNYT